MVGYIADLATWPDTPVDAGVAARAARRGRRAHRRLVELIEAGDAEGAETLWRDHVLAGEDRPVQGAGATAVLDLLG